MMTCQSFEQYLVDYLEGSLSSKYMRDVDAHLQQCEQCRDELAEQQNIAEQLRRLTAVQCPDRVLESVFTQLEQEQRHRSWRERLQSWFTTNKLTWKVGTVVTAMLMLAAIAMLYQGGGNPPVQPPQYGAEELERAKRDIALTLAYVNFYTQQTGHIVEQQLVATRNAVTQPVQETMHSQLQSTRKAISRPLEDEMLQVLNSLLVF